MEVTFCVCVFTVLFPDVPEAEHYHWYMMSHVEPKSKVSFSVEPVLSQIFFLGHICGINQSLCSDPRNFLSDKLLKLNLSCTIRWYLATGIYC